MSDCQDTSIEVPSQLSRCKFTMNCLLGLDNGTHCRAIIPYEPCNHPEMFLRYGVLRLDRQPEERLIRRVITALGADPLNPAGKDVRIFENNHAHVTEDGEVIMSEYIYSQLKFIENVTHTNDGIVKLNGLPPILQAFRVCISVSLYRRLIVLTQDHRVIAFSTLHPDGIEIKLPPIRRLYNCHDHPYALDVNGNYYKLKFPSYDDSDLIEVLESSPNHVIEQNVRMVEYDCTTDSKMILTYDNRLSIYKVSKSCTKLCEFHLEGEVKFLSRSLIVYVDNTVEICEARKKIWSKIKYITPDCVIKDIIIYGGVLNVIDNNGKLLRNDNYGQNEKYTRFIRFNHVLVETEDGRLFTLPDYESKSYTCVNRSVKILNVDKTIERLDGMRNVKSGTKK